ncbi:MAG: DUF4197 domain-containing protein [Acidobacteria bacterium]|nr:DUF4197 domain-containing protein [Acidobacteriota bacterium]
MKRSKLSKTSGLILFAALLMTMTSSVSAQWWKIGNKKDPDKTGTSNRSTNGISDNTIALGLKEALTKGVRFAVDNLGTKDGFYKNLDVKIPLPKSLNRIAQVARYAGYSDRVDAFELSMNRAAEKAVPVAIDVFVDSIKQMTFTDAKNILFSGEDDAATQFFRRTTEEKLRGKFRPIVEKFTAETGVTQSYKSMIDKAGFMAAFIGNDARDLDGYVTQKALDGTFYMVAQEEKKIRKDPIGRTTKILRDVFGILK